MNIVNLVGVISEAFETKGNFTGLISGPVYKVNLLNPYDGSQKVSNKSCQEKKRKEKKNNHTHKIEFVTFTTILRNIWHFWNIIKVLFIHQLMHR